MVRIAGVVLPGHKNIEIALTAIKGVGRSSALHLLKEAKIDPHTKAEKLTETQEGLLRSLVEKIVTEGDLVRKVSLDIKRLQDIGTWRGNRHKKKLPVRGQTSRRNARTRRGKRKTGLSGRVTLTKT
jgi:small subunit ribosomal protein S13